MERHLTPINNENDTVAVDEIKFGDNDNLAAMIANVVGADLFINLTTTDGLYDADPAVNKKATRIPLVREIDAAMEAAATDKTSSVGTGGMKSKILAAKKVTAIGIPCVIAPGKNKKVLSGIMAGKDIGTLFLPQSSRLASRKYWIAFTLHPRGRVILDDGAAKALTEKGTSLLPSGITEVEGEFDAGDPVAGGGVGGSHIRISTQDVHHDLERAVRRCVVNDDDGVRQPALLQDAAQGRLDPSLGVVGDHQRRDAAHRRRRLSASRWISASY